MLRRLFASVLVVVLSAVLGAGSFWLIGEKQALAQEQDNKNCPPGFNYERMSGQCCVQDRATLPAHGKIGYTGNSLCEDGYVGEYERRETTDGKGPPGCPGLASFAFLTACRPAGSGGSTEGGGGAIAIGGSAPDNPVSEAIRDASESLYEGGDGPSRRDLAVVGGAVGTVGILMGLGTIALGAPPIPASSQSTWFRPGSSAKENLTRFWKQWLTKAEADVKRLTPEWVKAVKEIKALEKQLSWYRYQYWKRVPFIGLFMAGSGLFMALTLGKSAVVTKVLVGIFGGPVAQLTGGPSYPYEAAKWIEKIKGQIAASKAKELQLWKQLSAAEEQVRAAKEALAGLR
jgi:hypothetical protein